MSYSETVNLVEEKGFKESFIDLYDSYTIANIAMEKAEKELQKAKCTLSMTCSNIQHLIAIGAKNNKTITEEGMPVIRYVINDKVIHFKYAGDDNIIVGEYKLTRE